MSEFFHTIVFNIFPLLVAIIFHEISHGLVAYALGDDTAKRAGRFKLYTHFDLWGSFLIPLGLYISNFPFLIGYAKPVPINPFNFKHPIKDMAIVAAAGPLYNFIVAVICTLCLPHVHEGFMFQMLLSFAFINFGLFFFNLIPIPPLDGSRILAAIMPLKFLPTWYKLESFGFIIIMGLELLSNPLSELLGYKVGLFYTFVEKPMRAVFSFFLS